MALLIGMEAVAPVRFRQGSLELGYRYEGCPLVVSAGIVMQDETAHVQTLILAPGEVREMNGQFLSALTTDPDELVDSAGLEIEYSTAPGTVLASVQAVAADGRLSLRRVHAVQRFSAE